MIENLIKVVGPIKDVVEIEFTKNNFSKNRDKKGVNSLLIIHRVVLITWNTI